MIYQQTKTNTYQVYFSVEIIKCSWLSEISNVDIATDHFNLKFW